MGELLGDVDGFVENIDQTFKMIGIERWELSALDHLGYRTETLKEYEQALEEFRKLGGDMGAIEIEGRPINIINLDEPIRTGDDWVIPFVEVIAPKAGSPKPSGLEHAEFVTTQLLGDFERRHADLTFIRDAMHRRPNPELKYRENGISVKFHRMNIGTVVELEAEEKAEQ